MIIDGKEWKLVPVEATQAMLDAAEKIDWSGEDVLGNCCNQWYAMLAAAPPAPVVEVTKATCAKVARANVDARLATAPDEILESVTASGVLAWLFKWQQVLSPHLGMVTREELARAGGGVHGGPLGCRRRRKRVERDCSPRLAQEPRPQGDRGWGVSRTWVAVGVRGNWSVEDLAKPNGENIVADCGNDPWSESNARKIAKAQDEITALRARIAELERDAARLSWIEEKTNSAERPIEEGRPVDAVATIRNAQSDARENAARGNRQGYGGVEVSDHESTSNCEPIRYPRHKITATTFLVSTEIDEEDKDQPRVIEVKLSDEAPGLLVLQCKIHEDRHIAFFVEQWRALRKAIDTLVAIDETKANLMDQT